MPISPLDAFNTVVGVSSLILGAVGLIDNTEERDPQLDAISDEIDGLAASMTALRTTNTEILERIDDLTQRDLATALVRVDLANFGLSNYDRDENPSDTLVGRIQRDATFGLQNVLAQFDGLSAPVDPEMAAYMAEAITYALATRYKTIEMFEDRAIGQAAYHDALQEAAVALEAVNSGLNTWIMTRPVEVANAPLDFTPITHWPAIEIAQVAMDLEDYPGLYSRFAAFGNATMSTVSIRSISQDWAIDTYGVQYGVAITNQIEERIVAELPFRVITMRETLIDEDGTHIQTEVYNIRSHLPYQDVLVQAEARGQASIRDLRAEQAQELTVNTLSQAADAYRDLADGDDIVDLSGGASTLTGTEGNDLLTGKEGHDELNGLADADVLNGGSGRDTLNGGDGADVLLGEDGADKLYGDAGNDELFGGDKNDRLYGGADDDTMSGGTGDDRLYGEAGNDSLSGDGSHDRLEGGDGNDTLDGGNGHDVLKGGSGDDLLAGGRGADLLTGGEGADVFVFNASAGDDTITDFDMVQDAVMISGRGADDLVFAHTLEGTEMHWNGNSVLFEGITIDASDILFV